MRIFRIILGLWIDLILFGALVPWAAIHMGQRFDRAFPFSFAINRFLPESLGIVLSTLGAFWLLWSWYLLVRRGQGYMTELFGLEISPVTVELVTMGPYAVHRHPVCAGYLTILLGVGFLIGSTGLIVVCVPVLFVGACIYLRRFEEPALRKRFGEAYDDYAGRVPMFFPARRNRIPVALKNLRADRIRFTINVLGIAVAVLLICFQLSILRGTRTQITTYIDHVGADLWVMQKGVDDFIATSVTPASSVESINKQSGVRKAAGIYAIYTLLNVSGMKSRIYVVGYDTESGDGGPWKLGETLLRIKDTRSLADDDVLLDETLARRHGLHPGDRVPIFGHTFTIAGLTRETTSIGSQYVFLSRKTVGRILPGGRLSFTHILVWSDGRVPQADMVRRIEAITGLGCLTRDSLAANMREFLGTFMLPLLTAGVIMGFLVGSATIGITLYTAVLERIREYGTMKALGATDAFLFGVLLKQSLISLFIGAVIGLILAVAANFSINLWVPGMTARLDTSIVLETFLAGACMAVLSTGLPMWRLSRFDPMEVFRT